MNLSFTINITELYRIKSASELFYINRMNMYLITRKHKLI